MPVGRARRARALGVDDDHDAAAALGGLQERHEVGGGGGRVVAPDEDHVAVDGVGVGHGPARAQGGIDGIFSRRAADGPVELAGPQAVPEAAAADAHVDQAQCAAVAVGQDSRRAIVGDDAPPVVADLADCFVPGDGRPLARALRPHAAQRVGQPVGVVDVLQVGAHLAADPAVGDGVVGVAIEGHGAAVDDLDDGAAGVGAVVGAGAADKSDVGGCWLVGRQGWIAQDRDPYSAARWARLERDYGGEWGRRQLQVQCHFLH